MAPVRPPWPGRQALALAEALDDHAHALDATCDRCAVEVRAVPGLEHELRRLVWAVADAAGRARNEYAEEREPEGLP